MVLASVEKNMANKTLHSVILNYSLARKNFIPLMYSLLEVEK